MALENSNRKQNREAQDNALPKVSHPQLPAACGLMRSFIAIVALLCLVPEAGIQADDAGSTELRVSATIPSAYCEYPKTCAPPAADVATRLVVTGRVIRYIGSPPTVSRTRGRLSILF